MLNLKCRQPGQEKPVDYLPKAGSHFRVQHFDLEFLNWCGLIEPIYPRQWVRSAHRRQEAYQMRRYG